MVQSNRPNFGGILFFGLCLTLSVYFMFAAVQGDYGVFKRAEIQAEASTLRLEMTDLQSEIDALENLTRRLSDDYLDLDLLDEQARDVLGFVRVDEVIVQ